MLKKTVIILTVLCATVCSSSDAATLSVAVATNFYPALQKIAEKYHQSDLTELTISPGATGSLVSQIMFGAPYDVFLAADTTSVALLTGKMFIDATSVATYAFGKIVLVSRSIDSSMSLIDALARSHHIAIAQPELAPYGRATRQALEQLQLWNVLRHAFVYARSISECYHFVTTQSTDCAFIAYSQYITVPEASFTGVWPVSDSLYSPIEQRMGIVAKSRKKTAAAKLLAFIQSSAGKELIRSFGYIVPE